MKNLILYIFFLLPLFSFGNNNKKIVYHLKLGFIKGGEAQLDIIDTLYEGKKAIYYKLEGKTTGISDLFFKVYDIYETYADPETFLPFKSIRNVKERKYRYYNEVTYHRDIDSIYSQRSGWKKAPQNLVDIITVFFYFTKEKYIEKIDNGEIVTLPTMHSDEINDINVKFLGFESIDTKLGKIECYVLSPQVDAGKLLKRSDGVKFYITKDTKIPVLVEFDMKAGSLRAILEDYDTNN
jgi:hypothetical protein